MRTYDEVVEKINNARRFGKLSGVEVSKVVLEQLHNPQKDIPYIHVAGTNGKGSTCAFLTSMLMAAGKRTGTFISPHLIDFEERIQVDGKMISKEDVTRIGNYLLDTEWPVELTMFDYCLAMAVIYFKECECDIAVMETGLGGTLDSTNALGTPVVTVLTKIGLDHTAILGDSLAGIARQKAGILRSGIPVISQMQEEEAMHEIESCVKEIQADPLITVSSEDIEYVRKVHPSLIGRYQYENGAGAVLAARELGISETAIQKGLQNAKWMGRMEILSKKPFLLVDGAHNGHGVLALQKSLMELYPNEKFHFVMGVMADKDYERMIEELLPLAIDFATVTPDSSRALQADQLATCIQSKNIPTKAYNCIENVFENLHQEEKTIAFGSLYFIGELEAMWKNYKL